MNYLNFKSTDNFNDLIDLILFYRPDYKMKDLKKLKTKYGIKKAKQILYNIYIKLEYKNIK